MQLVEYEPDPGGGWGLEGDGWIWWAAALLLIAAIVFAFARRGSPAAAPSDTEDADPETLVKRRYALGEIDEAEMRRKLDELRSE